MILTREQITRLHAGETLDHTEPLRPSHAQTLTDGRKVWIAPWSIGRDYAIQRQPDEGKQLGKAVCRAHVIALWLDERNHVWRLQLTVARVREEPARLLTPAGKPPHLAKPPKTKQPEDEHTPAAHGYTDRPDRAMPGEPEAIPEDVQHRFTKQARMTDEQRRLAETSERLRGEQLSLDERITRIEQVARENGLDVSSDLKVAYAARDRCARRLDAIEQRIHDQRAA